MGTLPAIPKPGKPITAEQVLKIEDEVIAALPTIVEIGEGLDWVHRARAIEMYLRSPELQKPMLGAQRHIEARIGELLGPGKHGGDRKSDQATRADVDLISRDGDRADFRLLARALNGECELTRQVWRKSRRSLVSYIRKILGLMPESPDLPEGQFSCIVADPPWQQTTGPEVFNGTGERGGQPLAYETLSVEKISKLEDKSGRLINDCMADDAHLYLWTINKYVEQTYGIARAWGFKPSVLLTWCKKERGVGLGGTFKQTTEFILFCRRGKLEHAQTIPTTWFEWPRGKHSAKPNEFYQMVESVTPSKRRLDLFARKVRDGWHCWGDEVVNDNQA